MKAFGAALSAALVLVSATAMAADYPAPKQGDWIAKNFKFHTGDAPHVTVSARHGDAGWAFSVRDNGIGLPKDSAIFEMFKRGGGEHEGSGIGLATCRRIVEAHGGRIWAEPAPGGGSTFLFTLPA